MTFVDPSFDTFLKDIFSRQKRKTLYDKERAKNLMELTITHTGSGRRGEGQGSLDRT